MKLINFFLVKTLTNLPDLFLIWMHRSEQECVECLIMLILLQTGGKTATKATYIPNSYAKAQNTWIDSFYSSNGYLEVTTLSGQFYCQECTVVNVL
jgi:hypothetical protein